MNINFDISDVENALRQAADTIIRPHFRKLEKSDIREKNPGDLVTIADEETEIFLTQKLKAILPESGIVGEETVAQNPQSVSALEENEWVWIIDPIDGTANYARGDARFAIIVALLHKGIPVAGWMYDVMGDRMIRCIKGQGVTINDDPLPAFCEDKKNSDICGFTRPEFFPKRFHDVIFGNMARFAGTSYHRAASHDYIGILTGKGDFAVYNMMKPWDHVAGCMMIQELGGKAARIQGSRPYKPSDFLDKNARGLLIANTPQNWETVRDTMFNGVPEYSD